MSTILLISIISVFRYFVPFVYVTEEQFSEQKPYHSVYYELHVDSIGNETEYIINSENDSVLQTYKYNAIYKPDSSWITPIRSRIDSLETIIKSTSDKEMKKHIQSDINWLKERYF